MGRCRDRGKMGLVSRILNEEKDGDVVESVDEDGKDQAFALKKNKRIDKA